MCWCVGVWHVRASQGLNRALAEQSSSAVRALDLYNTHSAQHTRTHTHENTHSD